MSHATRAAMKKAARLLEEHGLRLNEDKSKVVSFERGFHFLGHIFMRSLVIKSLAQEEDEETVQLLRKVAGDDQKQLDRQEEERERRKAGLDPVLRVLYVMEPGRRLTVRNQAFAVEEASGLPDELTWRDILVVPHQQIDRIELGPHGKYSEEALKWALATDTLVAFVNGHGETAGWVAPDFATRAGRHLAQAKLALDQTGRLALAKKFVEGRIKNQRAQLRRLNNNRRHKSILKALAEINLLVRRVPHEKSIQSLMGIEGRAAALYWPALGQCLEYGFKLRRRIRDKNMGKVNIMLNMTAALLTRDITVSLWRAGLHPGFGILHATGDYRDAAVYDLMEEFRAPLCESPVISAINSRVVSADMFSRVPGTGLHMGRDAAKGLIRSYERAAMREIKSQRTGKRANWRGIMSEQAALLARHFEGKEDYEPYVMDY